MPTAHCRSRLLVIVATAWLTSACALSSRDTPDTEPDDAGEPATCGAEQSRLRGVCLNDCGGDVSQLDPEFAGDLKPIANLCEPSLLGKPLAAQFDEAGGSVSLVTAATSTAAGRVELELRFSALQLAGARLVIGKACTIVHETQAPSDVVLHDQLGLSPAGKYAHVILRERDPDVPNTSRRSRAYVVSQSCVAQQHELGPSANEAAIMLADDPKRLIVSGYMEGLGTGLFAGMQYIAQGGRPLRRYGDDGLLALSGLGHGAVWLTLLPARALNAGPFPVTGLQSEGQEWPHIFVVLPGRGLVGDRPVRVGLDGEHWLFDIQHENGRLFRNGTTTRFASQRFSRVVPVEGSKLVVLEHARGLLVAE